MLFFLKAIPSYIERSPFVASLLTLILGTLTLVFIEKHLDPKFLGAFSDAHPAIYQVARGSVVISVNVLLIVILHTNRLYRKIEAFGIMDLMGTYKCFYASPHNRRGREKNEKRKRETFSSHLETSKEFVYAGICAFEILGGVGEFKKKTDPQGYLYEIISQRDDLKVKLYLLNPEKEDNLVKRANQLPKTDYNVEMLKRELRKSLEKIVELKENGKDIELYFYNDFPFVRMFIFDNIISSSFYEKGIHGEDALAILCRKHHKKDSGNEIETYLYKQFSMAFKYFMHGVNRPVSIKKINEQIERLKV